MACRSCKKPLDRLSLRPFAVAEAWESQASRTLRVSRRALPVHARRLHTTPPRNQTAGDSFMFKVQKWLVQPVADRLKTTARKTTHTYMVYGATEHMYKACSAQAAYTITQADRKAGKIQILEGGEEVGFGGGMWHDDFKLLPTFSTWAQVTMLHMYILVVRLRCLDQENFRAWQSQLVDHFFHEAETKMELTHDVTSKALRQRYLKDLFVQWRGLMLAYDEGLVKGDAVLASALWRNLFKHGEDVDMRVLAAIVSWMRLSLKNLDQMEDEVYVTNAASAFKWPAKSELTLVDRPTRALKGIYGEAAKEKVSPATK